MAIEFLPLTADDISSVIELGESTPEFRTGTDAPSFYSAATLDRWFAAEGGVTLGVKDGSLLAGFLLGQAMMGSRDAYINTTVVAAPYRRLGIASELNRRALKQFAALGCNHVFSVVNVTDEPMLRLKEQLGFQVSPEAFRYVEIMIEPKE